MDRWRDSQTDKNNIVLAHPYYGGGWGWGGGCGGGGGGGMSCSKFGSISPSGLGGDSMLEGGIHNIPIASFKKSGDNYHFSC